MRTALRLTSCVAARGGNVLDDEEHLALRGSGRARGGQSPRWPADPRAAGGPARAVGCSPAAACAIDASSASFCWRARIVSMSPLSPTSASTTSTQRHEHQRTARSAGARRPARRRAAGLVARTGIGLRSALVADRLRHDASSVVHQFRPESDRRIQPAVRTRRPTRPPMTPSPTASSC